MCSAIIILVSSPLPSYSKTSRTYPLHFYPAYIHASDVSTRCFLHHFNALYDCLSAKYLQLRFQKRLQITTPIPHFYFLPLSPLLQRFIVASLYPSIPSLLYHITLTPYHSADRNNLPLHNSHFSRCEGSKEGQLVFFKEIRGLEKSRK